MSCERIAGRMPGEREVERRPQRLDDLIGEAAQVAPPILERVEDGDPAGRITDDQRQAIGPHGLLVGEAEQVAHRVGGQLVAARGQQLVEDRLRVAHAPAGEARDERDGLGLGDATVGGEDPVAACPRSGGWEAAGSRSAARGKPRPVGSGCCPWCRR